MPVDELLLLQLELIGQIQKAQTLDVMQLSAGAEKLWLDVYSKISRDQGGLVGSVLSRAESNVMRISMIYALSEGSETVRAVHLEAALAFWNYIDNSVKFIFGGKESDAISNKILHNLSMRPLTKTDIFDLFQRKIKKNQLNSALKDLQAKGRIKIKKQTTGRRPKTVFELC